MKGFVVIAFVLLVATPVAAQPVKIEKPAPPAEQRERVRAVITPARSGEGRPLEADNYPTGGRGPSAPCFISVATAERSSEYEALGYDFLAITDHEDLIGSSYWRALPRLSTRLLLFHGVELNYRGFDQHIGRVLGDREVLHVLNHPARYKLSIAETLERVRTIQRNGLALDAVEVTDTGHHRPLYAS